MVGYLCNFPFLGVALGEVAWFFWGMRRFLLFFFFGQKQFHPQPDRFGYGEIMFLTIISHSFVRFFIEPCLYNEILGVVRFWPTCSWTQLVHLLSVPHK